MKYIKKYDNYTWEPKYQIGDYVLVYSPPDMSDIENEPMIIEYVDEYEKAYYCKFVFSQYYEYVIDDEIVRKLKDYEIDAIKYDFEMYKNMKKYNL